MLAMSSFRGLCSSLRIAFPLFSCFFSLFFSRSETNPHEFSHPTPHFSPSLSTTALHEVLHSWLYKVRITYLVVYGCLRMSFSPPIHLCSVTCVFLCWLLIPPGSFASMEQRRFVCGAGFSSSSTCGLFLVGFVPLDFYWHRFLDLGSLISAFPATDWWTIAVWFDWRRQRYSKFRMFYFNF